MKKNIAHFQYYIAFLIVLLLSCFKSNAKDQQKIFSSDFPYEILEINNSNLPTFEDLISQPNKYNFKFLGIGKGIAILPDKIYWIRFKKKPEKENSIWMVETSNLMQFELFLPQNGIYIKTIFNPFTTFKKRNLYTLKNTFIIDSKSDLWYYAKISSDIPIGLGFTILNLKDYIYYSTTENILLITFLTLILFLIFVTIIIYIRLKKKVVLYFGLFLMSNLFYYISNVGLIYSLFNIQKVDYRLFTFFYALITISFLMYSKAFLSINKSTIIGLNLISKLVLLRFLLLFLSMFEEFKILRSPNVDVIILTYCIIPTFFAIKLGIKSAYFYAVSLTLILISFSFHAFLSEIYYSTFLSYFASRVLSFSANYIQIFTFIQIVFFSYALIERYVEIKKENEFNANNAIKIQKFLNDEMSFMVKLKTKELEIANQKIQESADKISEMNKLLQTDNENLTKNVELLKKARFIDQNLNFTEFKNTFYTDEIAYSFLAQLKWKNGYHCKKCNYNKFYELDHLASRKCKVCGFTESSISDTLLDNIHFSSVKALYIVYLTYHLPKTSVSSLAKDIDLRVATCSVFYNKVKEHIETEVKSKKITKGDSENDNSWLSILV